jgi:hypothetical protein
MTLVSYLLFAYQDRFDCAFHRDSILEIMRVTRGEARIYPTVTFGSTAERIHSNATMRFGAAGSRIHKNRNRFRVPGEFEFLPTRHAGPGEKL